MTGGCEGCFNGNLERQQVTAAAKKYAIENKITVIIYMDGQNYYYVEAGKANGAIPIEYISQYNSAATKTVY